MDYGLQKKRWIDCMGVKGLKMLSHQEDVIIGVEFNVALIGAFGQCRHFAFLPDRMISLPLLPLSTPCTVLQVLLKFHSRIEGEACGGMWERMEETPLH